MRRKFFMVFTGLAIIIFVHEGTGPLTAVPRPTAGAASLGWTAVSDQYAIGYGTAVAGAGDIDQDGYADILIGSHQYSGAFLGEGRVTLHLGSAAGPVDTPAWTGYGGQTGASFGSSIAAAGDVNGDGYPDVIVGAPLREFGGETDEGMAFLYYGSAAGLGTDPGWSAEGGQTGAHFGHSVASAGDVDGDGYGDVIVGAPLYGGAAAEEGRAFLYLGSAAGLSPTPAWIGAPGLFGSGYGTAVGSAGDVDGDGLGDVIVGAPLYDQGGFFDQGRAFVYHGTAGGLSVDPAWTVDSLATLAHLGQAAGGAGDVDGDGFDDVLIGVPGDGAGRAHLYAGSAAGLPLTPDWSGRIRKAPAQFGAAVAALGDFDSDGNPDVAVSAPRTGDRAQPGEGVVHIYSGGANGLGRQPVMIMEGDAPNAHLGAALDAAGDVNGDGVMDMIVGAPDYDNLTSQGRVFVFFGGIPPR